MFTSEYSNLKSEMAKLEEKFKDSALAKDIEKTKELSIRYGEVKELVSDIELLNKKRNELEENKSILLEDDPEMKKLAEEEIERLNRETKALEEKIRFALMPPDPNNDRSVILEIRAGAGGDEASLFAGDLFRMYLLFSQSKNWNVEILDQHRNSIGGYKELIANIRGKDVYKHFKNESGVHRVQRIPSTEKNGRIHTSTVTVAVLPEAKEAEIKIDPKDIRIDVFRSSGPGGQSVNMTDSAVRITHLPTGIVVSCQDQKSQHKNKEKALKVLESKLLALEEEKKRKERGDLRAGQIGSGDRSEKIRTYNYPQNRVTDHRTKKSFYNLEEILEGKMDELIKSFTETEK